MQKAWQAKARGTKRQRGNQWYLLFGVMWHELLNDINLQVPGEKILNSINYLLIMLK